MVEITQGRSPAFAVNGNAAFLLRRRHKVSLTVPFEPDADPGIVAAFRAAHLKKILSQKEIFIPIPIPFTMKARQILLPAAGLSVALLFSSCAVEQHHCGV